MKSQILCGIAILGLLSGCAWTGKHVGASAYNDQNVLTGGPVTGMTLTDLPDSVKETLKQKVPTAEISDVQRENVSGKTVYRVTFLDSTKNPVMWIAEDGSEVRVSSQ